jgi:hypothetical protein
MSTRKLRFYEIINSTSNVNFMLDFECVNLKKENMIEAFKLVKKRHPYFRMQIRATNEDDTLEFVEDPDWAENVYLEHFELASKLNLNNWQSRLINLGSKPRDSSITVVYLELFSFENRLHQLFGCVNHAGESSINK